MAGPADITAAELTGLYQNLLGRAPDQAGFDWWMKSGDGGVNTLESVKQGFLSSDEYKNRNLPQTGLQGTESALTAAQQQANTRLDPFAQAGQQALNPLLALTGAKGQEAFDQAYTQSPYMKFLGDQGQQAVTRQASALGGLGGGNVQKELTRFGQGLAGQGLQQQIGNLSGLTGMGLGATGQQAGYDFGTGQSIAQARTRAGEQLSALANLQGQQIAQQLGSTSGNLANLLSGTGGQQAGLKTNLSQLLANLASQSAGQSAGLPSIPGIQETKGQLANLGQAAGGIATAIAASDVRLKENIRSIGIANGVNLYSWDWNEKGREIAKDQPSIGVIAQEVAKTHPNAVIMGSDGYLRVNYSEII